MLPICNICAKTKTLCPSCEKKLKNGEISELDVKIAEMVYDFGKGEFGFKKAVDVGNFVVILTQKREYIGKIIGEGGENLRKIEEAVGKPVRVISVGSLGEIISSFIYPANITAISRAYKTDGSVVQKITINKNDADKLKMDINSLKKVISSLTNTNVEVVLG